MIHIFEIFIHHKELVVGKSKEWKQGDRQENAVVALGGDSEGFAWGKWQL